MPNKAILMILDGWGSTQDPKESAIYKANTPNFDKLFNEYPHAQLRTDGMNVGLPEGQMGNSEVGHMNLGAGRIVYQDLAKINMAVDNDTLKDEAVLKEAFNYATTNDKAVHFLGLVSDGGVHSHIKHLKGLVHAADQAGVKNKYVHAFTDGRDVDPKSGKGFIEDLLPSLEENNAKLASVIGRYFAMDRDKRWERTKKAYDLIVNGVGKKTENPSEAIQESYDNDTTDEFIEPIVVTENNEPTATIQKGDVIIFFNFRTDRGRQLTQALSQEDFGDYEMKKIPLYFVTMTTYDESFESINVVYKKDNIKATLGEALEYSGKTQLRAAETEKYPHVTFFFSGGREKPFKGEERILVNSPKVATYDLQPEMSAYELTEKLEKEISKASIDFFCINFANPDMVGHTGDFDAAVKACETVDECLGKIYEAAKENYNMIILADHGNSEKMINEDGSANTAHTTNPVPVILVSPDKKEINDGILGDVAPTILDLMDIDQPELMTQKSILK
ncbi:2,3-bisphosphoglycerate-independent phosphoglycerate mutase [Mesonia mobilis]|uniref:2,3-bisphosphoglycerate-independent phosphoglycerate mutase n=1 Tax=Mesonia mobilis TaxID=369791 RepID=A0ABQ3BNC6_9FLAO|nr:2,3-bisphosphoglycerate-independent phosphoglycerate mutase [Mesonia mobilis]MBQ0738751.1 2,3-bisphosphoglycerate-independent phosphoglycerate mutase [Aquimarina celericrescens]GGZ47097.1 2,3-bisphosphoglycerate-independent phosphoglycerate mutase [Mesonia mobilis]